MTPSNLLTYLLLAVGLLCSPACLDIQATPSVQAPGKDSAPAKLERQESTALAKRAVAEGEWIEPSDHVRLQVLQGRILGVSFPTEGSNCLQRAEYQELLGSRYVEGDVHATDITPLLWRSMQVELTQEDGSVAEI